MIRRIFFILGCLYYGLALKAQNSAVGPEKVILPAPDVTAMQRYGNWPLGSFTGTANIDIPLFSVNCGKLSFPVHLSYGTMGIRTNDAGSNIGIGWALNATGVVNRNMMGGAVDEHPTRGYWVRYPFHSSSFTDPYDQVEQVGERAAGQLDAQPDVFNYSAGPLSGKFMFDTLQNVHLFPYQNHLIEKIITGNTYTNPLGGFSIYSPIIGFTITDENGTRYEFNDYEWSDNEAWVYENLNTNPDVDNSLITALSPYYIHTWYLTNIVSADRADTIHFSYTTNDVLYNVYGGSDMHTAEYVGGLPIPNPLPGFSKNRTIMHNNIREKVLSRISYNTGYIQFYQGADRLDMTGAKTIDSIVQYDYRNRKVTGYHLGYLYLKDTSLLSADQVPGGTAKEVIRLFLSSIQQMGINGTSLPPYRFSYEHSRGLPSKIMGGGDNWGLANGKVYDGIADSLMQFDYNHMQYARDAVLALKTPDYNYAKQGILTNISYPTGGSTDFIYEPHYKEARTRNVTTQVCDGNQSIIFTGIDFNPGPHGGGDPDAPGPRKFVVTDTATFDVTVSLDSRYANFPSYYYIEIRDSASNVLKYTYYNTSLYCDTYTSSPYPSCVKHLTLTPGTYLILPKNTGTVYSGPYDDIYCKLDIPAFNCRYIVTSIADSVAAGGVRLKETIDHDPVTGNSLATVYEYGNGIRPNQFTGNYYREVQWEYLHTGITSGGLDYPTDATQGERIISSNSTYPLTDASGFYLCYGNVKQTKIDLNSNATIGYTVNYYNNDIDDGLHDGDFSFLPYPPLTAQYWKRGKLIRTTQYKTKEDGSFLPVQDKVMSYSNLKEKGRVYGDALYQFHRMFPGSDPIPLPDNHDEYLAPVYYNHLTFYYPTSYQVLDSVTVKDYDDNGNYVQTKTFYRYDTTTLLQKSAAVTNSKGELTTTSYLRPFDFTGLTGTDDVTKGIKTLQDTRVLTAPVEVTLNKSNPDGSNNRTVGSVFTSYKPDKPLRDKVYVTEKSGTMTDFAPAAVSAGHVTKDSRYQPKVSFDRYDNFDNISLQHKEDDMNLAYIWDYQNGYPVAEVKNAVDSDIAYTSFEADNSGNWTVGAGTTDTTRSITGSNCYILAGTISKSDLASDHTYMVSYWTTNSTAFSITGTVNGYPTKGKTINGWTLYIHKVTGQSTISISGSGLIDELRLYPAEAQMTTYTFRPLVGMTSQCDMGNRITYYEYDGLQRLKRIRDQDYNILKSLDYQYQGSSGCGTNCYIMTMQTSAGTNTMGYPVGVFNIHGKLLGNAAGASQYVTLWNNDTADSRIGTLSIGGDSLHFNMTLNSGQTLPSGVTGCRYYQADLPWSNFDGLRNTNAAYVDFGDGTGIKLPASPTEIAPTIPDRTTVSVIFSGEEWANVPYYIHTYPDTTLKTLTFYHNDDALNDHLDNVNNPATSLTRLKHFRGNLPQNLAIFGGSCYQQASMNSIDSIYNWYSLHNITYFHLLSGDRINPCKNLAYAQDFMKNNKGLQKIVTEISLYANGYRDTTFKLSRLKSDWNTYFTELQQLAINEDHWNHEDLSALKKLNYFILLATTQNHQDDPNSPLIPIPSPVLDSILNQIAAGAGQTVSNGAIALVTGGSLRTSASDAAVQVLLSKGWTIYINGVALTNP